MLEKEISRGFGFDIFIFNNIFLNERNKDERPHPESFQWLLDDAGIKGRRKPIIY